MTDVKQIKRELILAALSGGIAAFVSSIRGANLLGHDANAYIVAGTNVLMVSIKTEHGQRFFEVRIKETPI